MAEFGQSVCLNYCSHQTHNRSISGRVAFFAAFARSFSPASPRNYFLPGLRTGSKYAQLWQIRKAVSTAHGRASHRTQILAVESKLKPIIQGIPLEMAL